jgi:hypothetical protein
LRGSSKRERRCSSVPWIRAGYFTLAMGRIHFIGSSPGWIRSPSLDHLH